MPVEGVRAAFHGHRVGRTSYSIMAQGNITQILSSKPEDRRMILKKPPASPNQGAKKGVVAQTRIYRPKSLARRRFDPRSESGNRFAPTSGRQGAPLQTIDAGVAAPGHAVGASSIRRFAVGDQRASVGGGKTAAGNRRHLGQGPAGRR